MNPLDAPGAADALARQLLDDIDAACVEHYSGGHRNHLGASLIGEECSRKLWYSFRWVHQEQFTGQQLRLFQRGHLEEFRFVEWLKWIGAEVKEFQDDGVTQHRISASHGHFGGSLDGMLTLPTKYGELPMFLTEFKTSNDAGFKKLQKEKVTIGKPMHFAQMSTYGVHYQFEYAIYMCINKNTDHIHLEVVKLDWNLGIEMMRKADSIIFDGVIPRKLSQTPTFFKCKWCAYANICHRGAEPEHNCRSCAFSAPVADAKWHCSKYQCDLDEALIKTGCTDWQSVTSE